MIKSKKGTTQVYGDIAEILSDFTVIVNSVYETLLREEVDKKEAITMIVEHIAAGLMSKKEFDKYMKTNDASEKASEVFKVYNKTRSKLFN